MGTQRADREGNLKISCNREATDGGKRKKPGGKKRILPVAQ